MAHFAKGCSDFDCLPTSGFFCIKPLKVASKKCGYFCGPVHSIGSEEKSAANSPMELPQGRGGLVLLPPVAAATHGDVSPVFRDNNCVAHLSLESRKRVP